MKLRGMEEREEEKYGISRKTMRRLPPPGDWVYTQNSEKLNIGIWPHPQPFP